MAVFSFYLKLKIFSEPVIAFLLFLTFLPLLILIAILIKLTCPGPILYSQRRRGLHGHSFQMHKFRSMIFDAEQSGPEWAQENDPRTTLIGGFLRKTHLDELPQLFNVIRGEMSLIGPRPERPEFYDQLEQVIPQFKDRTQVKPGITGWAQIMGGYAASIEDSKKKLKFDLYYIENISFGFDLKILFKTLIYWMICFLKTIPALRTLTRSGKTHPTSIP